MKRLHRQLEKSLNSNSVSPQADADLRGQTEPYGHVHPNFRHWTWFRPTEQK